jgi:predicted DNA-binding transcriptional regulator YafY
VRAPSGSAPPPARPRGRPRGPFTQHRRLDALRSLLQRHPKGLTLYELARELDVTPRSMRRYLAEVRRELDLVAATPKPGGARVWRLAPGEAPRRVEVRRTQAYALLAARRLFEPMKGSTLYEEIDLAAQQLLGVARRPGRGPNAGVADARLEERFLYMPFAPKDYQAHTEALDDLFQAVADLRPLNCRYRRAKDGREDKVTIHPYAMVLYKDAIYCVGLHVGRNDIRTFLLDRMRDTECATTERFELPPTFRVEDYFQGQFGIFSGGSPRRVVVDFSPKVADYVRTRKVHPSQVIEELSNGWVRLALDISDMTELTSWVLGFGETARVVEPPELVERVKQELANALEHYQQQQQDDGEDRSSKGKKRAAATAPA